MLGMGIIGASGYVGAELLRICAEHPELSVEYATADRQAGKSMAEVHPQLASTYPDFRLEKFVEDACEGLDLLFLALPHGQSQVIVPGLHKRVEKIVDLSADFRLKDASQYAQWYGRQHQAPELLDEFAFGIPELFRPSLVGADLIAAAGCYVTAASLALVPLVRNELIETDGVVVDAVSGYSGAGNSPNAAAIAENAHENFSAYGLLDHRHTPEIEQATGAQVLFTPHLASMTRGIMATCYARPKRPSDTNDLLVALKTFYNDDAFVNVTEDPPETKATYGSNSAFITARFDERTGWVLAISVLDNLIKGAAGQAVQCANLALGLDETTGLSTAEVNP